MAQSMDDINMNRRPVPSLTMICEDIFKTLTINTLLKFIDFRDTSIPNTVVSDIRDYMAKVGTTGYVNESLLNLILTNEEYPQLLRLYSLKIFLIETCTSLVTGSILPPHDADVFKEIMKSGDGLTVLNLNGVWTYDHNLKLVIDIFKKCKKLRKLFIPAISNDDTLIAISENLKNLSILDISGRTDITEIGLDALTSGFCAQYLTVVDIGSPGEKDICYTDIALILERCPNVLSLGTYSFVGVSLAYILKNVNSQFKCKLEYLRDTETTDEILNAIVRSCPELKSLYLHIPSIKNCDCLSQLCLEEFKILSCTKAELINYLKKVGQHLRMLNVADIEEKINFAELYDLCPNLLHFAAIDIDYIDLPTKDRFYKLETLKFMTVRYSKEDFMDFICSTPNLKSIYVDEVNLNNEDILTLFCHHSFECLENIYFRWAPELGVFAIEIIVEHCPKLTRIGKTSGWNIEFQELSYLECLLRSGNANVKLLM